MEAIYIIVGLLVGALIGYLLAKNRIGQQLTAAQIERERALAQLQAEQANHDSEMELLGEQEAKREQLISQQFEAQLNTLREQFGTLAQKVLDQTTVKLQATNTQSMESITRPLKADMDNLKRAIQDTNRETVDSKASLSKQIEEMMRQTAKMDKTATRLTNVIRGNNKAQGSWGERMLAELLQAQGLREGIDYDLQQTITDQHGAAATNDDSGRRMIPDVILHYPNNEDVIIDSKMSIDAYYQYVNTEDETLRRKYASDIAKNIRIQASNLAKKDYSSYVSPPRHAIDFVIMFVPNEGALQLAMATDPKLWGEAFEKQVFITSQQNLLAILKMIQIAWRQYNQTENQKKVFGLAEELLKRVGDFIKRFERVGADIDKLRDDYNAAYDKAYRGRQSITQKANQLVELGVKENANYPIPETLADAVEG